MLLEDNFFHSALNKMVDLDAEVVLASAVALREYFSSDRIDREWLVCKELAFRHHHPWVVQMARADTYEQQ
jgi:hypothetical protein